VNDCVRAVITPVEMNNWKKRKINEEV